MIWDLSQSLRRLSLLREEKLLRFRLFGQMRAVWRLWALMRAAMVPSERLESSWGCEGFWYLVEILPLLFSTSGIFELISHASPCE